MPWLGGTGPTDGESLHLASADALVAALVPHATDAESGWQELDRLRSDLLSATEAVIAYFNHAVLAYVRDAQGGKDAAPQA